MRTKKSTLHGKASLANETIKSSLFATIFTFLSNVGGIKAILEEQLKIYLFPFAALTEVITTLLALTGLVTAKNRNLGKTFDLVHSVAVTSLVLTAVVGGLWFGLAPIIVSSLFVAAIGMGALYNLGQLAYHAYRWLSSPSTPETNAFKAMYRNQTIKYGIASLVGLAVVAGIVTTLMLPMAAPIVLAVGGITAAVTLGIGLSYQIYKFLNPVIVSEKHSLDKTEDTDSISSLDSEQALVVNTKRRDYYNIQPSGEHTKAELLAWIFNKEDSLKKQIEESKETYSGRLQKTKREHKLDYLAQLKDSLANENAANEQAAIWTIKPGAFQSFFKQVGDVERIANATAKFLETKLQQETIQRPNASLF